MIKGVSFPLGNNVYAHLYKAGDSSIRWDNLNDLGNVSVYDDGKYSSKAPFEYRESNLNITPLRLKETVRYSCVIWSEDEFDYSPYEPSLRNMSNKFLKIESEKNHFVFQFINYLGKSELLFGDKVSLPFEVVPDKINYETDYVNLTEAIAEECSALLLEYSSPTSLTFSQDPMEQYKSVLEQFIFLRQFCYSENIESLLASIKRNPDRLLVEEDTLRPFGQGIPSKKFFTNPFSVSRAWNDSGNGTYLPAEISVTHKYDSFDTPANRFLKFALNIFLDICNSIVSAVDPSSFYYDEALSMKNSINEVLLDSFFDDVQELTIMPVNNQVLEKREGYSQIFKAFSMVDLALQLEWEGKDDIYSGESKNTALLYEYWLFFELRKIISSISGCRPVQTDDQNSFIKENDGLTISLRQDKTSVQQFETLSQRINLYYNRTFGKQDFINSKYEGSYSRPFRPDYTIAIFPNNYKREKTAVADGAVSYIHFDAKYRLEDLSQFINNTWEEDFQSEKTDAVVNTYKRGDLLKMHTYNDAIRRTVGSYVLYPGTDDKDGKCFSVFEEILPGVGAFAIRPSDVNNHALNAGEIAVQNFIKDILEFNANPAGRAARSTYFENMIAETPGVENSVDARNADSAYTMIGFVREAYYRYLQSKYLVPMTLADKGCIGREFYFYYHAIKNGKVYTLHKDTNKARYLRLTLTDYHNAQIIKGERFDDLEPWRAEIISTALVSKQQLKDILSDFPGKDSFQADFYYLVKAKVLDFYDGGIVAVSTEENDIISPYSPKIVKFEL